MNCPLKLSWFGYTPLLGSAVVLGFHRFRHNNPPVSVIPDASRRPVSAPRRSVEERISAAMRNWIEERAELDLPQVEAAVPEPEPPVPDAQTISLPAIRLVKAIERPGIAGRRG